MVVRICIRSASVLIVLAAVARTNELYLFDSGRMAMLIDEMPHPGIISAGRYTSLNLALIIVLLSLGSVLWIIPAFLAANQRILVSLTLLMSVFLIGISLTSLFYFDLLQTIAFFLSATLLLVSSFLMVRISD